MIIPTELKIRNKDNSLTRNYNDRRNTVSSVSFKGESSQQEEKGERLSSLLWN